MGSALPRRGSGRHVPMSQGPRRSASARQLSPTARWVASAWCTTLGDHAVIASPNRGTTEPGGRSAGWRTPTPTQPRQGYLTAAIEAEPGTRGADNAHDHRPRNDRPDDDQRGSVAGVVHDRRWGTGQAAAESAGGDLPAHHAQAPDGR